MNETLTVASSQSDKYPDPPRTIKTGTKLVDYYAPMLAGKSLDVAIVILGDLLEQRFGRKYSTEVVKGYYWHSLRDLRIRENEYLFPVANSLSDFGQWLQELAREFDRLVHEQEQNSATRQQKKQPIPPADPPATPEVNFDDPSATLDVLVPAALGLVKNLQTKSAVNKLYRVFNGRFKKNSIQTHLWRARNEQRRLSNETFRNLGRLINDASAKLRKLRSEFVKLEDHHATLQEKTVTSVAESQGTNEENTRLKRKMRYAARELLLISGSAPEIVDTLMGETLHQPTSQESKDS